MEVIEANARRARWWVGGLIALSLLGVGYQGWSEARRMKPMKSGGAAADFRMRRADGKGDVVLSELRGKVVMLDFWATWCGPCAQEMPALTRLAQEYEGKGLVFVAANRDETTTAEEDVKLFAQQIAPELLRFVAYADGETGERYQLRVLPTLFFIGPDGQLLASHLGQATEHQLRSWIESALATRRP